MTDTASLFSVFATHLSATGGSALSLAASDVAGAILQRSGSAEIWTTPELIATWPTIVADLRDRAITLRTDGTPESLRDQPCGMTCARAAIAETGSVILAEPELNARAVSLMTHRLIVLIDARDVIATLDDAAPILRDLATPGPSYATFVSGPSRTADIERELAVGVQGPGEVTVIAVSSDRQGE